MEIKLELHPQQLMVFNDPARFKTVAAGRRWGKTHMARAMVVCKSLDLGNKNRQPVFVIAPTQAQAKLLYWRPLLDVLNPLVETVNINEGLIYLKGGVLIGVKGADNPDSLRGPGLFHAILDEFGSMKPYVWEEIIRPTLVDSRGGALFIGTPTPERNHFFDLFQEGLREGSEYKSWQFRTADNPFIDPKEVMKAKGTMASDSFNREFMASFDTELSGEFKREWFKYYD